MSKSPESTATSSNNKLQLLKEDETSAEEGSPSKKPDIQDTLKLIELLTTSKSQQLTLLEQLAGSLGLLEKQIEAQSGFV